MSRLVQKISVVVRMALVLSLTSTLLMPVVAYAAAPVISVNTVSAQQGDTVRLTVGIVDNPGFAALNLTVGYNSSALDLINIAPVGVLAGRGIPFVSDTTVNDNFSLASLSNITGDGALVELTFRVAANAPLGSSSVSISLKDGLAANFVSEQGALVPVAFTAGAVSITQSTPGGGTTPPGGGTTPPGGGTAGTGTGTDTGTTDDTDTTETPSTTGPGTGPDTDTGTVGNDNEGDNGDDTINIGEPGTPQAPGSPSGLQWALFDLVFTLLTLLAMLFAIIRVIGSQGREGFRGRPAFLVISVAAAAISLVLFLVTQDITQPMTVFDTWSIPFALLTLLAASSALLVVARSSTSPEHYR